jgi:hypothetical protein
MALSIVEFAKVRDTVSELLDELRLDAYLFEIEPRDEQWELKVDCAVEADGAWETITLSVSKQTLLLSRNDVPARRRMLTEWRERLAACKLRAGRGDDENAIPDH